MLLHFCDDHGSEDEHMCDIASPELIVHYSLHVSFLHHEEDPHQSPHVFMWSLAVSPVIVSTALAATCPNLQYILK